MHPGDDPSPSQTPLPSALYHMEKFEGNGLIPFDKFIRDFELVYDVKALDDSRRRILLDNHLRGAAREFALQASQIKLGYNELKENLELRFSRRAPKREARKKFFSCRQRPGEKVKEYANRVRSLASEAESDGLRIDITEVADIFLTGLCPNLWQRTHQLQNESWEVIVSSLHQIEERDDEYSGCQMEDEEGSARKLRELTSQMARLESKLKNLETENQDLRRTHREQPRMNMGNRWDNNQARGFQRRGGSAQNNQPTIQGTRQERPQQNPNGRAPQEQRKEGPPATTKGGAPRGNADTHQVLQMRGDRPHGKNLHSHDKKIGPACLKAGNGGTLAGLPVITCTFVDKGWSLSNRTIRLIIDTGSEANIVNIDSLDISAEGLGKPTFLKGISGSELRSLGSGLGFDGILGMPGFKALRLTLNHDGSVRSDFEQDEEPTKSAFLSSLQASEVPVRPPSIPLHKIRTGEDVLRAYSHCFCDDISDMGDGSTIIAPKLKILTGKPVYRRQYPIPNKLVSKVKALVDELEEAGIIEGSTSLWNSPLFPVAKTDGSVRITMDLRLINEVTEFFPFPIPRVEDNLRAFAGAKVFSTLDLTSGFFQIRIPEGAKNSAQIFQWAMNLVLGDLLYKCVRLYIDDVIVYSDSHEQHVADLAAVLERLSRFNLKARRGKSYFFKGSVDYLGHVIDQDGIKPMWDNVAALRDLKRPHNIRGVRSLLGTVNYYRRFIPNAGICKAMGVSAVNTTAWRPQSNGAVERLNRTVIESLRRCEASSNWDDILPMVALAIRTTEHSSTGFTPAKLVFGHELRLPQPFQEAGQSPVSEDLIAQTAAFYERELTEEVEKLREVVRQTYLNEQEEARIKFENKRLRTFNNGDLVLVERMHETKGRHKFEPRYGGPYEVLRRAGDTVYLLKNLETGNLDKYHIDRLKQYHIPIRIFPTEKEETSDGNSSQGSSDEDHWIHLTGPAYLPNRSVNVVVPQGVTTRANSEVMRRGEVDRKEGSNESSTPSGKDGVERTYHKEGLLLKAKEESGRVKHEVYQTIVLY
ncbi:K02A2.6-like [Cordylochernes scorpioides]|uniref:K02A2.6-like n=1 Tax=Cordylochernes scorpioides TaxID=51811 RepID=A0ABY6LNN9_9ARAC|nr:K02A2.6-like [Cordylochernes scorpioides]